MPDLTFVSVRCPGTVQSGQTATIRATVQNGGAADYPHHIVVQAPGNHAGGISGLRAGESKNVDVPMPFYGPNTTFTFRLTIDPDNVIEEANEANNVSQQECVVRVLP